MLTDIKGTLYYLIANVRYPFIVFWSILLSIFFIAIVLSTIGGSTHVLFQASIPIYIFCLVLGMVTVKNTIPYLLKMSVTRKLIYLSVGIFFLLIAFIQAVLANLLTRLIDLIGKTAVSGEITMFQGDTQFAFEFTHLSQFLTNDSFAIQVTVDTIIAFAALSSMFFIGLIFYRFGLIGGFSFIGVIFIIYIASIVQGSFIDLVNYVLNNYSMTLYFQLFGISVVVYLLSYVVLRRLTITSA